MPHTGEDLSKELQKVWWRYLPWLRRNRGLGIAVRRFDPPYTGSGFTPQLVRYFAIHHSGRGINPRPAGRGRICPPPPGFSQLVQNRCRYRHKFGVPYSTSNDQILSKSVGNFWETDVFVGSLHANFDQNRFNVKKFAKNRISKQTAQKDQHGCKILRSTKWLSRNFKIISL